VVKSVIEAHMARTGTEVQLTEAEVPGLSAAAKICLYRFVQEGLNNAWRYAEGQGQRVAMEVAGARLTVVVSDEGPGYPAVAQPMAEDGGMGLAGLRDRVESLGGTLETGNRAAQPGRPAGAEMRMVLDVESVT
jgi:signal transduction histidine kinase